jgi:hypothetical protein
MGYRVRVSDEGPLTPEEWFLAALARAGYRSELSGDKVFVCSGVPVADRCAHAHHIVSKQWLRRNGYHDLVWEPRNAMMLTKREHEAHENGSRRIRRGELRGDTLAFAREIGPPAEVELERKHPA